MKGNTMKDTTELEIGQGKFAQAALEDGKVRRLYLPSKELTIEEFDTLLGSLCEYEIEAGVQGTTIEEQDDYEDGEEYN
jgi:hypothetical protein